jgi:chromosome partitioning protein
VVRRAVTLGLPVILLAQEAEAANQDNVVNDYRRVATELVEHGTAIGA